MINLLIGFWIDFWSDLVPLWLHLGLPNLSKMGPSWLQNRCKLECWFENCFCNDLGTTFIDFLTQHDMAEVATTKQKLLNFLIFELLVVVLLRWFVDWFVDWFWVDFWVVNWSKINQTSTRKKEKGSKATCDFGSILKGSWIDFGPKLGGKLGASWHQIASKINPKINQKNDHLSDRSWDRFSSILGPKVAPKRGSCFFHFRCF